MANFYFSNQIMYLILVFGLEVHHGLFILVEI
jgi:hypothetical protein